MEILNSWLKNCRLAWKWQYSIDYNIFTDFINNWTNDKIELLNYHRNYYGFIRKFLLLFFYLLPQIFIWNRVIRYTLLPVEALFYTTLPVFLKPKIFYTYLGKLVFHCIYFIETIFWLLPLIKAISNLLKWIIEKWYIWKENKIERMMQFQEKYINVEYLNYLQKRISSDWDVDFEKKLVKRGKNLLELLKKIKKTVTFWIAARRIYIKYRLRTRKIRGKLRRKVYRYRWNFLKLHLSNPKWWIVQIKRKLVQWYLQVSMGFFVIDLTIKAVLLTILWPILPIRLLERIWYRIVAIENNIKFSIIVKVLKFIKKRISTRNYAKIWKWISKTHIFGSYEPMPKGTRKFGPKQTKQ